MNKKSIIGIAIAIVAVLCICGCSLNKPDESERARIANLTEEFNEEYDYDIDMEMVSNKKLSSEKFDEIETEDKAIYFYELVQEFGTGSKFVISSNGNKYKADVEYGKGSDLVDGYVSLYKNGELLEEVEYEEPQEYYGGGSSDGEEDYSDLKWEPTIGMTKSEVLDTTWGTPDDRNITETEYGDVEQWIYNDLGWIYFTNGICDGIQYKEDYLN